MSGGAGVHYGFADLGQLGVRQLLYVKSFSQRNEYSFKTKAPSERHERAVRRNLVVFNLIAIHDQRGVSGEASIFEIESLTALVILSKISLSFVSGSTPRVPKTRSSRVT
jgi:hypothetical protein